MAEISIFEDEAFGVVNLLTVINEEHALPGGRDGVVPGNVKLGEHDSGSTTTADGRNGVNLYRANVLPRLLRPEPRHAVAPVQLIIPMRDRFVSPELYEGLSRWVPNLRRRAIDAGHWLLLSHPDKVARCIAEWVGEHASGSARPLSTAAAKANRA